MIYVLRYAAVAVYTVIWGTIGMLLFPFVRRDWAAPWVVRNWNAWILHTCGIRIVCEGVDRAADAEPCVVMSNHQSVFDIAALSTTLPIDWKFVAKRELIWIPFFGWALGLARQIIVDRSNNERAVASLRRAAERVRGGCNVIVFPEGTRSKAGGMGPFKSGGFQSHPTGLPLYDLEFLCG